jgi:hypothetical protein
VSSSTAAYGTQNECRVSISEMIRNAKRSKYFDSNLKKLSLLKMKIKHLHVQCVFYAMKLRQIIVWRLASQVVSLV